jgi:hypothetical protein
LEKTEMPEERRELRSWRQRLEQPLKASAEKQPEESPRQNRQNRQNPDSLRVGFVGDVENEHDKTPVSYDKTHRESAVNVGSDRLPDFAERAPDPCVIAGCSETRADLVYCVGHRALADAGTLWGRGFTPGLPHFVRIGPSRWVESDWSRVRCVTDGCEALLAGDDPLHCVDHGGRSLSEVAA